MSLSAPVLQRSLALRRPRATVRELAAPPCWAPLHERRGPSASAAAAICARWLPLLALLSLFHGVTSILPKDSGSKLLLSEPPRIESATNTTLLVAVDADWCVGCTADWEIKEANASAWRGAGAGPVGQRHLVSGLRPDTMYAVRALLRGGAGAGADAGPAANTTTCRDQPSKPRYMWPIERETTVLSVQWASYVDECVTTRYYISWKPYVSGDEDDSREDDSPPSACPSNATYLSNRTTDLCPEEDCFTVNDLTPATRYMFKVWTVDWTGKCSAPLTYRTATKLPFLGRFTIGLSILIISSVLLLAAAATALVLFIQRKAARKATEATVAFSRDLRNYEAHLGDSDRGADEDAFSEPVTRIERKNAGR